MFTFSVVMLVFCMLATAIGLFTWDTKNRVLDRLVILFLMGALLFVTIRFQEIRELEMIVHEQSRNYKPHSYTV